MNRNKHATDDGFQRSQRRAPCRTHVPAGIIALSLFLVVAISGAASAGEAERAEAEAVVNLEFHDTDLAAALEALCRGADVNFVLEPGVKGKVTAKLLNTSWQTALDTILSGHGLRAERRGDTLLIARATPGAGGTAPKQRIDVEMTPDGKVSLDAAAAQIVEGLEASPVQVTIETRIVETNLTGEESFGIKWSESIGINATTPEIPHSWPLRNGKTSDSDDFLPTIDPDDTRTRGDNVVPHAESDDFKFGFLTSTGLSATLDMLETETKTRLLANPTVTTYENQQARINIVTKYPMAQYQVSQDTGVLSISGFDYKEFGTILEVTPRVRGDHVIMQIHPEVSRQAGSTQFQGVELPVIQSQETQTQVRIKGGDTLVIAGLIREETENNKQDVPFISKIPLLGRLFRHKQDKIDSRRNLMIFITPHIVGSADFARDAKLRTLRTEPLPTVEAFDKE